jgi:hypothetical protein
LRDVVDVLETNVTVGGESLAESGKEREVGESTMGVRSIVVDPLDSSEVRGAETERAGIGGTVIGGGTLTDIFDERLRRRREGSSSTMDVGLGGGFVAGLGAVGCCCCCCWTSSRRFPVEEAGVSVREWVPVSGGGMGWLVLVVRVRMDVGVGDGVGDGRVLVSLLGAGDLVLILVC